MISRKPVSNAQVRYVDAYVVPVPKKDLKAYVRLARAASKVWHDHGALNYMETLGDHLQTNFGVPFTRPIKLRPGETLVFASITFKSRAHRDRVNARVMKDPRILNACDLKDLPFNPKRMLYGGFKVFVSA